MTQSNWVRQPSRKVGARSVPSSLQQACFKRDRYTCQRCRHEGQPGDGTLHADHIINRARGGQDTLENLTTLCTTCHLPKTKAEQKAGKNRSKRPPTVHPADLLGGRTVSQPVWPKASEWRRQ